MNPVSRIRRPARFRRRMSRFESVWLEALERRRVMSSPAVLGAEFAQFAFGDTFAEDFVSNAHQLDDGRLLLSGTERTYSIDEGGFQTQAVYARLNADYSIDTTFGDGGVVRPAGEEWLGSTVVADDGSFYAYGEQEGLWPLQATRILRFNADGSLDTSFGTNGVSIVGFGAQNQVRGGDARIDPQGRLVFSGLLQNRDLQNHDPIGEPTPAIFRVNVDGSLDRTFGASGLLVLESNFTVTEGTGYSYFGGGIAFRADGGFYFGGQIMSSGGEAELSSASVFSFTSDGAVDQSFGAGGEVVLLEGVGMPSSVTDLKLGATGDLIAIVSTVQPRFTPQTAGQTVPLLRLYKITGGALDARFAQGAVIDDDTFPEYPETGATGLATLFSGRPAAVAVDANGSIRVAYQEEPRIRPAAMGPSDPALIRVVVFSASGELIGEAQRVANIESRLLAVWSNSFTATGDLMSIGTIYSGGYFDSKLSPEEYFARSGTGDIFITRLITADDITAPDFDEPIAEAPSVSAPIDRVAELRNDMDRPSLMSLLSADDEVDEFGELLAA